jgi:23S rRNA pseudouridine1911/1915/1917 synthase
MTETKEAPYIADETDDYAVIFKPHRMHCAPLGRRDGTTLLEWYGKLFPPVFSLRGRKSGEGGLLHRLDFETEGLVLFAKNQQTLDFLIEQQKEGRFIKEYSAVCIKSPLIHAGFPTYPGFAQTVIESFFRPFGPGGKEVRPVLEKKYFNKIASDRGRYYRTEIHGRTALDAQSDARFNDKLSDCNSDLKYQFLIKILRGFRHQIRCHLAWIGYPIVNDAVYGQTRNSEGEGMEKNFLALRAYGISFSDMSGRHREYRVEPVLQ